MDAAFEALPVATIVALRDGSKLTINARARALLKLDEGALLGSLDELEAHAKLLTETGTPLDPPLSSSLNGTTIQQLTARAGDRRWTVDATPFDDQGVGLGTIVTLHDITERLLDEEMGDDLLGRASHDLRTPLTALKASAQLIGRGFERLDENAKQRTLALLLGQIDKLSTRIDEVMDASRIRRGRIDVQAEPLDLAALLQEVCTEISALPGMPRCELRAKAPLRAHGDRVRVRQMLKRLAVDAAARGTSGIIVDATSTDSVVSITIEIVGESADDSRRRTHRRLATKLFERLGGTSGEDAAQRLVLTLPVAAP